LTLWGNVRRVIALSRANLARWGDAMHHVFTHSFDYIALGILIALMLFAATKVIPRRNP